MTAHANSVASLQEEQAQGRLGSRAAVILEQARRWPEPRLFSDREMLRAIGMTDMNAVRPRITELVSMGLLLEVCTTTDPMTRKTVRLCRAATQAEIQAAMRRAAEARARAAQMELFPSSAKAKEGRP